MGNILSALGGVISDCEYRNEFEKFSAGNGDPKNNRRHVETVHAQHYDPVTKKPEHRRGTKLLPLVEHVNPAAATETEL